MTVLIAWGSLSVGIVIGAMWRSLCENQSGHNSTDIVDGSLNLQRFISKPDPWPSQHSRVEGRKRPA